MLATVLYCAAGIPTVSGADSFTDTAADTWYSDAVVWASAQGLVNGYGDDTFGTDDPVSHNSVAEARNDVSAWVTELGYAQAQQPSTPGDNSADVMLYLSKVHTSMYLCLSQSRISNSQSFPNPSGVYLPQAAVEQIEKFIHQVSAL